MNLRTNHSPSDEVIDEIVGKILAAPLTVPLNMLKHTTKAAGGAATQGVKSTGQIAHQTRKSVTQATGLTKTPQEKMEAQKLKREKAITKTLKKDPVKAKFMKQAIEPDESGQTSLRAHIEHTNFDNFLNEVIEERSQAALKRLEASKKASPEAKKAAGKQLAARSLASDVRKAVGRTSTAADVQKDRGTIHDRLASKKKAAARAEAIDKTKKAVVSGAKKTGAALATGAKKTGAAVAAGAAGLAKGTLKGAKGAAKKIGAARQARKVEAEKTAAERLATSRQKDTGGGSHTLSPGDISKKPTDKLRSRSEYTKAKDEYRGAQAKALAGTERKRAYRTGKAEGKAASARAKGRLKGVEGGILRRGVRRLTGRSEKFQRRLAQYGDAGHGGGAQQQQLSPADKAKQKEKQVTTQKIATESRQGQFNSLIPTESTRR